MGAKGRRRRERPIPPRLGWREWVSLPDIGIPRLRAKLDTGARTSALHTLGIETIVNDGVDVVRFVADPDPERPATTYSAELPIIDERLVRSSTGQEELRIVVRTTLVIGGRSWPIELTLANRVPMKYRMLIGREALRGHALVDPGASYLAGKPRRLLFARDEEE